MMKARWVAMLAPESPRYTAPATTAPSAAIFLTGARRPSPGTSTSPKRSTAKTAPVSSPICSPEIASRCARFEARRSTRSRGSIAERSPVRIAAAKPPLRDGICAWIARLSAIRARSSGSPAPSSCAASTTGSAVKPMAPRPRNQAWRRKSKPAGSTGGGGGVSRARIITRAPGCNASSTAAPPITTRTFAGVSCGSSPGMWTWSSQSLSRLLLERSNPMTRPLTGPKWICWSTGARSRSVCAFAVAKPSAPSPSISRIAPRLSLSRKTSSARPSPASARTAPPAGSRATEK